METMETIQPISTSISNPEKHSFMAAWFGKKERELIKQAENEQAGHTQPEKSRGRPISSLKRLFALLRVIGDVPVKYFHFITDDGSYDTFRKWNIEEWVKNETERHEREFARDFTSRLIAVGSYNQAEADRLCREAQSYSETLKKKILDRLMGMFKKAGPEDQVTILARSFDFLLYMIGYEIKADHTKRELKSMINETICMAREIIQPILN